MPQIATLQTPDTVVTDTGIILPAGYGRIKVVKTLEEMFAIPLDENTNCVICEDTTPHNLEHLDLTKIFNLAHDDCENFTRSQILKAADRLDDQSQKAALHRAHKDLTDLKNARDYIAGMFRVYSQSSKITYEQAYVFHVDGDTTETASEVIMRNYSGANTEWIRNEDALPSSVYNRFIPREDAIIYQFNHASFWRVSLCHRGMTSLPFVHRAPHSTQGERSIIAAIRDSDKPEKFDLY